MDKVIDGWIPKVMCLVACILQLSIVSIQTQSHALMLGKI